MAKILVLGNNPKDGLICTIPNALFLQMPIFSLGEDGERKIMEFIINNVPHDISGCVLNTDDISNPEMCLAFALALRLSLFETKTAALVPIFFASSATPEYFYGYAYSALLLTGSLTIDSHDNIPKVVDFFAPLSYNEYRTNFLDIIKVIPKATEGRHSLANQWGADVLSRTVLGDETNNSMIKNARLSFYFRYVRTLSLGINDFNKIINTNNDLTTPLLPEGIDAKKKNVLLIDDEADKGWEDVLRRLLKGAFFECFNEQINDFNGLSEVIKDNIKNDKYDLIFLDLRMNGVSEENVLKPEDFSGMKILKSIKEINKGTQVIMFTASNKAWNMKALLDAGADGYYIKESPEYSFSKIYTENNARQLCDTILSCFNRGYLRDFYKKLNNVKTMISNSNCFSQKTEEILNSIDVAFDLLAKSGDRQEYRAYSYLQLFLTIEEYVKLSLLFDQTETDLYLYNEGVRYRLLKNKTAKGNNSFSYDSVLSFKNGHYILNKGKYERAIDTNFLVSSLLIFKFNAETSGEKKWTKVYKTRNTKAAHPKTQNVSMNDFEILLAFMSFFFNEENSNWRPINDAFEDMSEEEHLDLLKAKFNC